MWCAYSSSQFTACPIEQTKFLVLSKTLYTYKILIDTITRRNQYGNGSATTHNACCTLPKAASVSSLIRQI